MCTTRVLTFDLESIKKPLIFKFEMILLFSGYFGSDCSVQTGVAPKVTGIHNKGLCDVGKTLCRRVSLYSQDGEFTDMDNTTCRVVTAEVGQ